MLPPLIHKISSLLQPRRRVDRRCAKRLSPNSPTPCLIRQAEGGAEHSAWVHNLSKTGVGLISAIDMTPGTTINLLIFNSAHTVVLSSEVTIARCTRIVGGHHFLGGKFLNPVQHDEMVPFLL